MAIDRNALPVNVDATYSDTGDSSRALHQQAHDAIHAAVRDDTTPFAHRLIRTAVKTGNYTAVVGDLVPVDTTSAAVTITLPNAPAVGSRVAVKLVTLGTGHAVTIACAGSDVFNKAGGSTSGTLTLLNQAMQVQYDTGGIWTVVADDLPKSQLDATYVAAWTASETVAAGVARRHPTTGEVLRAAFPHTTGATFDDYYWLRPGEAAPLLLATFDTDTAAGTLGSPEIGGTWSLAGVGAATARALSGYFTSPDGVTYANQVLASTPGRLRKRFKIDSSTTGPTVAASKDATLNVPTLNAVHVNVTTTFISTLIFTAGSSAPPSINIDGAVSLATGVDYDLDVRLIGNVISAQVIRVSDGALMGSYWGFDANAATQAGPLVFTEPNATSRVGAFAAYPGSVVSAPYKIAAPGGIDGPIGAQKPNVGLFKRVGVGTTQPATDLHVVSTSNVATEVDGSHASGALFQIKSTVAALAGILFSPNSAATGARIYQKNSTLELFFQTNGVDRFQVNNNGSTQFIFGFFPSTPSNAKQGFVAVYASDTVPSDAVGSDGFICYVGGGAGTPGTYQRRGGHWTLIST